LRWLKGQSDRTGYWHAAPAAAWEQDSKWRKFPGDSTPARSSLARGRQPGRTLEPACLETVGRTPQDSASTIRTTKPDQSPGTSTKTNKTSARRGTCRSPMLAHETSPVSGASVVGMTYGACHRPSYLTAGVPGVPTARRQEDRLCLKGRLCRQPAGISTGEG
jgi:hypothetical protein